MGEDLARDFEQASISDEARHEDPEAAWRERVARRAYERYELRGGAPGQDIEDWLEAEREIS